MPLTDDEAITLAGLHGCEFIPAANGLWYLNAELGRDHPIEVNNVLLEGRYGFASCEKLARAYCNFYKLNLEPSEIEPHDDLTPHT